MVLLGAMVFIVSLGYGAALPLIRPYLLRYLGAVPAPTVAWHVGMLGGVYLFALFMFAPLWGRLSNRHGRVLVLAVGFSAFRAGGAATALAPNLGFVYAARLLAGAGAAAIVPTAQAYIADLSSTIDRTRRFVLLGSASFIGFLVGPAFGTWLAGPVMGVTVGQMGSMLNWPALAVAAAGVPLLLLAPWCLGRNHPVPQSLAVKASASRRRFVHASMLLALLASFAVGTFEVGFNLFGSQTLGLTTTTMAAMFITCSLAMLAAQSMLLLSAVRSRIDQRWVTAAFAGSALALAFTSLVPDAGSARIDDRRRGHRCRNGWTRPVVRIARTPFRGPWKAPGSAGSGGQPGTGARLNGRRFAVHAGPCGAVLDGRLDLADRGGAVTDLVGPREEGRDGSLKRPCVRPAAGGSRDQCATHLHHGGTTAAPGSRCTLDHFATWISVTTMPVAAFSALNLTL